MSILCYHAFACYACTRKYYPMIFSIHKGKEICLQCSKYSDKLMTICWNFLKTYRKRDVCDAINILIIRWQYVEIFAIKLGDCEDNGNNCKK